MNLLNEKQSGFRPNHSTTTALFDIVENIRDNLIRNEVTILVLLDVSNAFPSVRHSLLFEALKSFNFHPNTLEWVKSSYFQRKQFLHIGSLVSDRSDPTNIDCGVLPGECNAQNYFIMFINGVFMVLRNCKGHLYADNFQIYLSGSL